MLLIPYITLVALAASIVADDLYADPSNYIEVFERALDGDVVELARGTYDVVEVIKIDRKLSIKGSGADFRVVDTSQAVFAFGSVAGFNTTIDGLTISINSGESSCTLADPYALQANFSIDISGATVKDNKVNLKTDVGPWHNDRRLVDFYFADCHYTADHTSKRMSGGVYKLLGNCHAQLDFSVAFDELGGVHPEKGCGTTIQKFETFTSYGGQVEAQWNEYVQKVDNQNDLRIPVLRAGNAVTNLLIQIDTVRDIVATINAEYEHCEIEAAINLVDVGFYNGWNHSKIRLETHLASPFTVEGGQIGTVGRVVETFDAEVSSISTYEFDAACNGMSRFDDCIQNVVFDIVACDLTGEYSLIDIHVQCQTENELGLPQECPAMPTDMAPPTIKFFLDTNNFCEVEEIQLVALFDLSIAVYNSDAYDAEESIFDLGSMSYWQIVVDTSLSGVALYNAEVTYAERTTDGDCSNFKDYLGDVSNPDSDFTQLYNPNAQTISMPIQVTAQMACATSDRTGNAITMNYTVLVDYDDGSARRRRDVNTPSRRDAGELSMKKEAGIRYTAEDLEQAQRAVDQTLSRGQTTDPNQDDSSTMTTIIAVVLCVLLLCCCCCCAVCGVIIKRRRDRSATVRKQKDFITSNSQGSIMTFGQRSGSFRSQSSDFGSQSITFGTVSTSSKMKLKSGTGV